MRVAWDALDLHINNKIEKPMVEHSVAHSRGIMGMKENESRTLFNTLLSDASQKQFVHVHTWRPGDLILWNNRFISHRGHPWNSQKYRRVIRRTTVGGDCFDE